MSGRKSRKPQFFRSKTVNTVLVVPSKARKYRQALYVFDFFLTGFGLTSLLLSAVMMVSARETFIPDWVFQFMLSLGLITLLMGFLGGRGATVSYSCLEHGRHNFWLIVLTIIVGMMLIIEVLGLIWVAIEYGAVQNDSVQDQSDVLSTSFEDSLKDKLTAQDEAWWDWQKNFECCGYDNNTIPDPLATGKYCTTDSETSAKPCKDQLWEDVAQQAVPVGFFIFFFMCLQFAVCISSICLACIIKAQEPIYRNM